MTNEEFINYMCNLEKLSSIKALNCIEMKDEKVKIGSVCYSNDKLKQIVCEDLLLLYKIKSHIYDEFKTKDNKCFIIKFDTLKESNEFEEWLESDN